MIFHRRRRSRLRARQSVASLLWNRLGSGHQARFCRSQLLCDAYRLRLHLWLGTPLVLLMMAQPYKTVLAATTPSLRLVCTSWRAYSSILIRPPAPLASTAAYRPRPQCPLLRGTRTGYATRSLAAAAAPGSHALVLHKQLRCRCRLWQRRPRAARAFEAAPLDYPQLRCCRRCWQLYPRAAQGSPASLPLPPRAA